MESVISNGKVSYTDNYNGFIYNAIIDGNLILSDIPSGKYDIIILNNKYEKIDVSLSNAVNTSYDGKYLIISDTNTDNSGTLNINLDNLKNHRGYQKEYNKNNYWKLQ